MLQGHEITRSSEKHGKDNGSQGRERNVENVERRKKSRKLSAEIAGDEDDMRKLDEDKGKWSKQQKGTGQPRNNGRKLPAEGKEANTADLHKTRGILGHCFLHLARTGYSEML